MLGRGLDCRKDGWHLTALKIGSRLLAAKPLVHLDFEQSLNITCGYLLCLN